MEKVSQIFCIKEGVRGRGGWGGWERVLGRGEGEESPRCFYHVQAMHPGWSDPSVPAELGKRKDRRWS